MMRLLKAVCALLVLLLLLVVPPLVLLEVGSGLPAAAELPDWLLARDDGQLLRALLTGIAWLAWGVFALSVVTELVALASRRRISLRLPGLATPQTFAKALLLLVGAGLSVAAPAQAAEVAPVVASDGGAQQEAGRSQTGAMPTKAWHRVQPGENLWSIAEQYLGSGQSWRLIADANPDLISEPDAIEVGWKLRIPDPDPAPPVPADGARIGEVLVPSTRSVPGSEVSPSTEMSDAESLAADATSMPAGAEVADEAAGPPTSRSDADESEATELDAELVSVGSSASEITAADEATPAVRADEIDTVSVLGGGAIGGLLAATLTSAVNRRRRVQAHQRPVGRRAVTPPAAQSVFAAELAHSQRTVSLRLLNLALRLIGVHCREKGLPLPRLGDITVDERSIRLGVLDPFAVPAPLKLVAGDWVIDADVALRLVEIEGLEDEPCPYPAVVTFGSLPGRLLLRDLEVNGPLSLAGEPPLIEAMLRALTLETTMSWWNEGQPVHVVGGDDDFLASIDAPQLHTYRTVEELLAALESSPDEGVRRALSLAQRRLDKVHCEPSLPDVVLIHHWMTPAQRDRFTSLRRHRPLVVVAADGVGRTCRLQSGTLASKLPDGRGFDPQLIPLETRDILAGLLRTTGSSETTPAPWWPETPPKVTPLVPARPAQPRPPAEESHTVQHPTVLLLGRIELRGARGTPPTRAQRQCVEYCAWLLEHAGATSPEMAASLLVAEGTRRSNVSRLRAWLGCNEEGEAYLPEAYSGRIRLHPDVTSDWQFLQLFTLNGVNYAPTQSLIDALDLVRGAPLADAAPGQWHWAEELRSDMAATVRDIGVELGGRCLARQEFDLARWAVNRALVANPEDEQLLATRIRIEHHLGNRREVERLAMRLVRHARVLNVDLADETVTLLQEVMEGAPRARVARIG